MYYLKANQTIPIIKIIRPEMSLLKPFFINRYKFEFWKFIILAIKRILKKSDKLFLKT